MCLKQLVTIVFSKCDLGKITSGIANHSKKCKIFGGSMPEAQIKQCPPTLRPGLFITNMYMNGLDTKAGINTELTNTLENLQSYEHGHQRPPSALTEERLSGKVFLTLMFAPNIPG